MIIELTAGRIATDHIDIFFLFFIELAVVFSIFYVQKQKTYLNILAGIFIGAAILCKWLPALIVLPIWLFLVFDSKKFNLKQIIFQFSILISFCFLVFMPWQIYIYSFFPLEAKWEASFNFKHITEVLEERTAPFYYFIDKIRINYGELIYAPLIWFIWKLYKNSKDLKNWALLIWIFIPLLFFSIVKTKMQAYILFISPALFIITAVFFFQLLEFKKKIKQKWIFNIILFLFIAFPIRYMIERVKLFNQIDRNVAWVTKVKELNNRDISKGILFNYEKSIEVMFYTNLTAYQFIPDKNKIIELMENGYTILINDNGEIPAEIKSIQGITFENLD